MLAFLVKGMCRDRHRSLLPLIVVVIGVFVIVTIEGIFGGLTSNMLNMTAHYQTGHLRVMTKAYSQEEAQKPNAFALLEVEALTADLRTAYPEMDWTSRILFGALLDIPDEKGETRAQGPVSGQAIDLLRPESQEVERMGLLKAVHEGRLIEQPGEILVSIDFAERFGLKPGHVASLFGSTMYGSLCLKNFEVVGILRFGNSFLDKGAVIIDISDARQFLDMEDAAGEIFGFFSAKSYKEAPAEEMKHDFNQRYEDENDEFVPIMSKLTDDVTVAETLLYIQVVSAVLTGLLMLALSIVLWNSGVLGGIRRYNEFGLRLAMGEEKSYIFKSLLVESLFIGLVGSVFGTLLGLLLAGVLQKYGINYGVALKNLTVLLDPFIRSEITPKLYYIGFIPGIIATLLGTALAGRAIYKRSTANLFKELD
jgi:ABC-type transport system, involved in lipoprotein release, permease component